MVNVSQKKLLQIELNEFDPVFLLNQAEKLGLDHTKKFLEFSHTTTITDDEVEHQGLDPWVQWVNIHTGLPSTRHGIKRLGDTSSQTTPQIWETLASKGKSWIAWGVMNAPMGNGEGAEAFMPDPWSFDEVAYPDNLNDLLSLPRYMARNYLETNKIVFLRKFLHFVKYYAPPSHWPNLLKFTKEVIKSSVSVGVSIHSLTTLLDYLSALEFVRLRKLKNPDYSTIFLNHIAHLQHQFWLDDDELHPEMKFGLQINNLIMELLLKSRKKNEAIFVVNGLKQKNVHKNGFHVYRQKNPVETIQALVLDKSMRVEQCMTNDAHLKFSTKKQADKIYAELKSITLSDGQDLFFVERVSDNHVFIQLCIEHNVDENALINTPHGEFRFYDLFEHVCERTGAHVPYGDIFSDGITFPSTIHNHEIYSQTLNYFDVPFSQAA